MKRAICLLLALCLLAGLCACRTEQEPEALTWEAQLDLGVRYLSEGKYEEAILAFTAAIGIDPKQEQAYVLRAEAYVGAGEYKQAAIDYLQAIGLNPTEPEHYLALAEVYVQLGDYASAVERLEQALQIVTDTRLEEKLQELLPLYAAQAESALAAFAADLPMVTDDTILRPCHIATKDFGNFTNDYLAMDPYDFPDGVLAQQLQDFDQDGVPELFTAEFAGDVLSFHVYEAKGTQISKTASVEIGRDLVEDTVSGPEWIHVFLKEYEGQTYVFYGEYNEGGYFADGSMLYLKGYDIKDGGLVQIMDLEDGGSSWYGAEEHLLEQNGVLAEFGFAPVFDPDRDGSKVDFDVFARTERTALAQIEQYYDGSVEYMYENLHAGTPENIDPLKLVIRTGLKDAPAEEEASDPADAYNWVAEGDDFEVVGLCYAVNQKYTTPASANKGGAVKHGPYLFEKDGYLGLMDINGAWIVMPQYQAISYNFSQWGRGEGAYILDDGLPHPDDHGYNEDLRELILYESGLLQYEETFMIGPDGMSVVVWDSTNQCFAHQFGQSYSVQLNYGFSGTMGVKSMYLQQDLTNTEDYFAPDETTDAYYQYGESSPYLAIATDGRLVTDFIFEDAAACSDGLIAVKQNGLWGYADSQGRLVIPCEYEAIRSRSASIGGANDQIPADCTEGYVVLCRTRKGVTEYGLYDSAGQEVIPFGVFDELTEVRNGKLWAKRGHTWGILTLE